MVVMVTHGGYVKRTALSAYRTQNRGGKGRGGMETKENDFVIRLFSADTHTEILFFSSTGMAYKQKVWRLPLGAPNARGKALVNILPLKEGERIKGTLVFEKAGKVEVEYKIEALGSNPAGAKAGAGHHSGHH